MAATVVQITLTVPVDVPASQADEVAQVAARSFLRKIGFPSTYEVVLNPEPPE